MKKKFDLEELDCANCAAKLEAAIKQIDGVKNAGVNFLMQKLTLEAEDDCFEEVLKEVVKTAKKVLPDCTIVL